jgi:hypothetical protein
MGEQMFGGDLAVDGVDGVEVLVHGALKREELQR